MASSLVSWVWTNAVEFSLEKCHKDRNSGRSVTCQCPFLLRLFSKVVSFMFLIKFSQLLHFCGIKDGYNFFFKNFRHLQRLTTPQLLRSAGAHAVCWFCVIASCQIMAIFQCTMALMLGIFTTVSNFSYLQVSSACKSCTFFV